MRFLPTIAVAASLLLSYSAFAEDSLPRERTKTGILPNGGFYTLYSVTCSDNRVVEVASTDRRQRWCAQSGADLACFRNADAASNKACAAGNLAASDSAGNEYTN